MAVTLVDVRLAGRLLKCGHSHNMLKEEIFLDVLTPPKRGLAGGMRDRTRGLRREESGAWSSSSSLPPLLSCSIVSPSTAASRLPYRLHCCACVDHSTRLDTLEFIALNPCCFQTTNTVHHAWRKRYVFPLRRVHRCLRV